MNLCSTNSRSFLEHVSTYLKGLATSFKKLVVILDIDGTILDFNENRLFSDVREIYKMAKMYGFLVGFVTARTDADQNYLRTTYQLNMLGIDYFNFLFMHDENAPRDKESISLYKYNARKELQSKGFVVVLNVGDQWGDVLDLSNNNANNFATTLSQLSGNTNAAIIFIPGNDDPAMLAIKVNPDRPM